MSNLVNGLMSDFLGTLSIILVMGLFMITFRFIVRLPVAFQFRKRAKKQVRELYDLIGATKYEFNNLLSLSGNGRSLYIRLLGSYKGREVKCFYTCITHFVGKTEGALLLEMKPLLAKSKLPYYKFVNEYPRTNNNHRYDGSRVFRDGVLNIGTEEVSKEYATELLEELTKACEEVENPNFVAIQ